MKKSERIKKRYVAFKVKCEKELSFKDVKEVLFSFMLSFFGEYGFSFLNLKLIHYDVNNKIGILRCNRKHLYPLLGALALIEKWNNIKIRVISLKVSGTIKSIKEEFFHS